jgi:hypothetical protein
LSLISKIDENGGVLEIYIEKPMSNDDVQNSLPQLIKNASDANATKWLIFLKFNESEVIEKPVDSFFIWNEMKLYAKKVAIVCPDYLEKRVKESLTVFKNEGKEFEIFRECSDAKYWLNEE